MNFVKSSQNLPIVLIHQKCTTYGSRKIHFDLIYDCSDLLASLPPQGCPTPYHHKFSKFTEAFGRSDHNGNYQRMKQEEDKPIRYTKINDLHNELRVYHKKLIEKRVPLETTQQHALCRWMSFSISHMIRKTSIGKTLTPEQFKGLQEVKSDAA